MMPRLFAAVTPLGRRPLCWILSLAALYGCSPLLMRPQSPDAQQAPQEEQADYWSVGELTFPQGMQLLKVESVALVTGLADTGSDPRPSPQRNRMIAEMQTHQAKNPSRILASPNTSMVLVRGYLPPGVQKGDRFDVEVRIRSGSKTKSLQGGWLMRSRLRRMEVLGGSIKTGDVSALAGGPVLIDAMFEGSQDEVFEVRGRILGGGESRESRTLGLVVRDGGYSMLTSTVIASEINRRFHLFENGLRHGVATPKTDRYIELDIHPRYKNNISRYVRVVQAITVSEAETGRAARLQMLQRQLLEPISAAVAAVRLEAIGDEAILTLQKGLDSSDTEVRFYAAEALAYLDQAEAAQPLAEMAEHEQALRWHALTALAAIDHIDAYEALTNLMNAASAEARYGAFRALRARNPHDPLVRSEPLSADFDFCVLPTSGEPMIHFARSRRPEIVLFGHDCTIGHPGVLSAGPNILIKGVGQNRLKVIRYSPGKDERSRTCSTQLDELLRTVIELGADYEGLLLCMQQAKLKGHLQARLVVGAAASPWRTYRRRSGADDDGDSSDGGPRVSTPLPELFRFQPDDDRDSDSTSGGDEFGDGSREPDPVLQPEEGFFDKIKGRFRPSRADR